MRATIIVKQEIEEISFNRNICILSITQVIWNYLILPSFGQRETPQPNPLHHNRIQVTGLERLNFLIVVVAALSDIYLRADADARCRCRPNGERGNGTERQNAQQKNENAERRRRERRKKKIVYSVTRIELYHSRNGANMWNMKITE